MSSSLRERLAPFGLPADGWVDLKAEPTPQSIRYLDLFRRRSTNRTRLDAIVEAQQEPIACVVDAVGAPNLDIPTLRSSVAMRGDIPYLVISHPGSLTVYPVSLDKANIDELQGHELRAEDKKAPSTFHRLHLAPDQEKERRFVHDVLFRLLTEAIDGLLGAGVDRDDAISLAGRALFTRFLLDRQILKKRDIPSVCPEATTAEGIFSDARRTGSTCRWLDNTFNGDFLPLSIGSAQKPFAAIHESGFYSLSNILCKTPRGQLRFDWSDLDFAHIPVGVLSQVYERQAEQWDAVGQRTQSVYYTPWRIADYMVREIFSGLKEHGPVLPHEARVLDPSVGGGVFLVAALQELVASWWAFHGSPPNTRQIRFILYRRLAGFDISEPALRLAALGLYLKAIELDPDPLPVEKLRFEPLRGTVLHNMRRRNESGARFVAGSLDAEAGKTHDGAFDVVIGNPPWTSLFEADGRAVHAQMVETVRPLVADRLGSERAAEFTIPDLVPDLPFVWRSLGWLRPKGWLAFALHARLLFKTSEAGKKAREDLFKAMTVTGALNGADLRKTEVWPHVSAHFCLLFASNEKPAADHSFYFASPYLEQNLNSQGRLRIDASAARPISLARLMETPHLLKSLFRGSGLDTAILGKLERQSLPTLKDYWNSEGLAHGQGYRIANRSRDASFLLGKPNLTTRSKLQFLVEPSSLLPFREPKLERPRSEKLYRGPLLLIRKSPPSRREEGRALVTFEDLAFNESFYGFSTRGHEHPRHLARYVFLIIHSNVFLWYVLMTSAEFGVERDSIQKEDIEKLPVPSLESLSERLSSQIQPVFDAVLAQDPEAFQNLDQWAAEIYELDSWDQQTIRDTLDVFLPFPASLRKAQSPPSSSEIHAFVQELKDGLVPFLGTSFQIRTPSDLDSPWQPILLQATHDKDEPFPALHAIYDLADQQGASQIFLPLGKGRLLIAILRQYRYWTPSRARLCSLAILDDHLELLDTSREAG